VLDQKLEKEIGKLLKGYGEGPKASMGLQAIDARITSLGAPKEVHAAVNAVVTEGFNVQKKELDGEGNKLKAMEEAKGESFRQTQLGIGKARTLALLFAKAVEYEVDPTRLAAIQAQVTAFEFGKHTYFSDGSGTMGMDNNQAYAKFAAVLADAINAAMLQKGGKS
jgi:regulator of protease activity HflC (stomatin/prohibitin superfamily)